MQTWTIGVKLSELFASEKDLLDINSQDATVMEKVKLIEGLSDEEKKRYSLYLMPSWVRKN